LRVLIITEEDELYLPLSIQHILQTCPYEIVEIACARNPLLPNKLKALKKFYKTFGIVPIAKHCLRLLKAKMLDKIPALNFTGRYYSVKQLCRAFNKPCRFVENINSEEFLNYCRQLSIDMVASVSSTQIFKKQLINLPKYGCINIHTAKLPKYRGLYPVYWAMAYGEKSLGVSIHYIEEGIDTGKIILQEEVAIPPHSTLDHMLKVTKIKGAELLVRAIGQIAEGTVQAFYSQDQGSYFSFPTPDSYKNFRSYGYKLW
jgi:methionyl-tRNA formyltransferase